MPAAIAHEGRPLRVQIEEIDTDSFLVQWTVPKSLPPEAMPRPVLPENCQAIGKPLLVDRRGAWLNRRNYRCPGGLGGKSLGIAWPVRNPSMTTLVRLDLRGGRHLVRVLEPGEQSWSLPELDFGAGARFRRAALALRAGVRHALGGRIHLAFLAAIVLAAGSRRSVALVTSFTAGQLAALAVGFLTGASLPTPLPEFGVALAVVFLAGEALRQKSDRRNLGGLSAAAGLCHGFAISATAEGGLAVFFVVLGIDATLLVLAGIAGLFAAALRERAGYSRMRAVTAYILGAAAVVAGLGLAWSVPERNLPARAASGSSGAPAVSTRALPGSRRVAPRNPDLPIRSFLDVDLHEVRHEVLLRPAEVATAAGLEVGRELEPERQEALLRDLGEWVAGITKVKIDGREQTPTLDRVDFMTVGDEGALPRTQALRETADKAVVGVTLVYFTVSTPWEVELSWEPFPESIPTIQTTAIDSESSRSEILMPESPTLIWVNDLVEARAEEITAVAVEPVTIPLPLLSLALLVAAVVLAAWPIVRRAAPRGLAVSRVLLALAVLAGPLANLALAVPGSADATPTEPRARRILAGLLPGVYRALELREESAVYDRLATSVTGEALTTVYLEQRKALELEERGGARARVEAVELLRVEGVGPGEGGGFEAQAAFTVGGTVTHFGHRHFRRNAYVARVVVVPEAGNWKIRSIEVLDEQRLR